MKALLNRRLLLALGILAFATFLAYCYTGSEHAVWIGSLAGLLLAVWVLARAYLPTQSVAERIGTVGVAALLGAFVYILCMGFPVWVARVVFLAALVVFGLWRLSRVGEAIWRPEELALLGRKKGLAFRPVDSSNIARNYGVFFQVLSRGEEPDVRNVLQGSVRGRRIYAFDCGGISAAMTPFDCGFKPVSIRPETVGGAAVDDQEKIAFESHEFTNRYRVTAEDRRYAYRVVTPRIMELLLAHPGFSVDLAGNVLLVYSNGLWSSDQFQEAVELLCQFAETLPQLVLNEFGAGRAPAATGKERS